MCGIAGFFDISGTARADELAAAATRMADTLRHRGPGSGDVWVDQGAGVALGHRRLAILDLSPLGHQPMVSANGRFVVVFNGEIYNFRDLRKELEACGARFRGHSDTEVLLAAVEQWGVRKAIDVSAGMFALALWDRDERRLHLVRDRLGKKPLYFGWVGERFMFASELKAFHADSRFAPEVDRGALALFLRYSCVPAPYSIYRGIHKLPPGTRLSLSVDEPRMHGGDLLKRVETYWSAIGVAERGAAAPLAFRDEHEAVDRLDSLLGTAVAERMIADVPLGALLSGGIDSSTVVALMQKHSSRPVNTYSIGFREQTFDEAVDAARVARHLGTHHDEIYISAETARSVIPQLPDIYDEPFSDQSQIPTFLVSKLARQHVTVALSGDGGDEVFGGYRRHFQAAQLERLQQVPAALRRIASRALTAVSPTGWDRLFSTLSAVGPRKRRHAHVGDSIHKLARVLLASTPEAAYRLLSSHWTEPTEVVRGAESEPVTASDPSLRPKLRDFAQTMMALDTVTFLPDDVLTKVDRASMAVSLELRAPILDHRVIEFAWQLPLGMKIRGSEGKWILRRVLDRYVPRSLIDKPKHGFGMPVGDWLRGPLKPWADALLDERRLDEEGFFEPAPIRNRWVQHLSGRRNWGYHLWDVLMFQAWKERWLR
jgi:asparagine synthase (glutamine-hydrolysing)